MSEFRSFFIGILVAGVVLGLIALALGAFSGDDDSPTARLLGTPVASPTAQSTLSAGSTAIPTLPSPTQAAPQATSDIQPTAEATATSEPVPTPDPVTIYVATIQPIVFDMDANVTYLTGQGSANPSGSTLSAETVKGLALRMQSASPPACLTTAHNILVQGALAASVAADQLIAALDQGNASLVSAALAGLGAARTTLSQGSTAVSNSAC